MSRWWTIKLAIKAAVSDKISFVAISDILRDYEAPLITRFFIYQPSSGTANTMRHIISILMQNEAGALARVVALFSSRGYNIESLNVAPTDDSQLSRLTLVTRGSDSIIDQINKQLLKLVDVVNTADMTMDDHIERELLLLKVTASASGKAALPHIIENAGARILDDTPENFTLELTGATHRMDDFIDQVASHAEILAVVRSGAMAIARGHQILSAEA